MSKPRIVEQSGRERCLKQCLSAIEEQLKLLPQMARAGQHKSMQIDISAIDGIIRLKVTHAEAIRFDE
jgi:hypothetical protein